MLRYFLQRLLLAIPTLVLLSMLAFFLSKLAPGDPVLVRLGGSQSDREFTIDRKQTVQAYLLAAREMHLDRPPFYFTVRRASVPDTIHRILPLDERQACLGLIRQYGNWERLQEFRHAIASLEEQAGLYLSGAESKKIFNICNFLRVADNVTSIKAHLEALDEYTRVHPAIDQATHDVRAAFDRFIRAKKPLASYLPAFSWYGIDNQYHHWAAGVLAGDMGKSSVDGRPVRGKVSEALRWTLLINIPAIILAFLIAIPLGVVSARRKGSSFDNITSSMLFALYAMPSFWLATLFVVFLTTTEYGAWTDLFPSQGLGNYRYATSTIQRWGILAVHLFLPVLSLTLGALAYLFRQMRNSILAEAARDYILLARAKGLSESRVYWRHAFPNALFPIITIIGGLLPAAVSGSVIIEVIFNIPGMGRLLFMSIQAKDWHVVFACLLLAGLLTIIGYLIADVLYAVADPRVKLQQKRRTI